jgi:hypothetical protein
MAARRCIVHLKQAHRRRGVRAFLEQRIACCKGADSHEGLELGVTQDRLGSL